MKLRIFENNDNPMQIMADLLKEKIAKDYNGYERQGTYIVLAESELDGSPQHYIFHWLDEDNEFYGWEYDWVRDEAWAAIYGYVQIDDIEVPYNI